MRRARSAKRAATEKSTSHVRGSTAAAGDDSLRRVLERRESGAEDAGIVQHAQRALVTGDVELVPRPSVERTPAVGPDLRCDPERSQEAERTARHGGIGNVQMDGDLPAPLQMLAASGVKEP
jgi:hypothetical protein